MSVRLETGKWKTITRTVPKKARDGEDGGVEVELRLAEELEREFACRHVAAVGDSAASVASAIDPEEDADATIGSGSVASDGVADEVEAGGNA